MPGSRIRKPIIMQKIKMTDMPQTSGTMKEARPFWAAVAPVLVEVLG